MTSSARRRAGRVHSIPSTTPLHHDTPSHHSTHHSTQHTARMREGEGLSAHHTTPRNTTEHGDRDAAPPAAPPEAQGRDILRAAGRRLKSRRARPPPTLGRRTHARTYAHTHTRIQPTIQTHACTGTHTRRTRTYKWLLTRHAPVYTHTHTGGRHYMTELTHGGTKFTQPVHMHTHICMHKRTRTR